ncbi:MAG: M12 family metallopeptidase [Prochloraceae cyanobacterium]|nr:M12 family metallopeptidase [Prochloraceae cyanobacterium]
MSTKKAIKSEKDTKSDSTYSNEQDIKQSYCSLPQVREREFDPRVNPNRARLILRNEKKWVNGTILDYYFFDQPTDGERVFFTDGTSEWRTWTTNDAEKDVVRQAFDIWKNLGIGLEFKEVNSRDEAEIRIGFMRGDGAWSYIGTDVLLAGRDERTMNFGWDLTRQAGEIDTAVHEIGHTLGFPHEHQNPNAGIVWDEEAVYAALAAPPNRWDRDTTYRNIIKKIEPDAVQGSDWDSNSIMHYPFEAGLIIEPEQYRNGLDPAPGLSDRDKTWVKTFYPPLSDNDYTELKPFKSVSLAIEPGQQRNFTIKPDATRYYNFSTFGVSDTVMVLFEDVDGELRYRTADDDSGEDYNSSFRVKLFKDRKYVLRIRLYYSDRAGETAVMMW